MSRILAAILGPLVWAAFFMSLYAAETAICTLVPDRPGAATVSGWVLTVAALAVLIAVGASQFKRAGRSGRFLDRAGWMLTALSILAVLWTALPLAWLAPCAT